MYFPKPVVAVEVNPFTEKWGVDLYSRPDVHTDFNSGYVLEVATGFLEHIIVKTRGYNGSEILAVGPVFSYYEFLTTTDNRLNDEKWRGLLPVQGCHRR